MRHFTDENGDCVFEMDVFHLVTADQMVKVLSKHDKSLRLKRLARQHYRFEFEQPRDESQTD
ncbi:hypothetical protein [Bowmanella sp. JS7-9]|uniref:Uncharacterized protein n=1 Tax=Pseudobowmanella zhangzhouensis TaxID=1537679 RepID=A0ABW1XLU5_9ALTE|nr:hypothetical protein [Bowmanella sp. JS7-9]TBX27255.1 hypothetical protein TK45_00435 [Bowmanella sp. JS7-9]